MIPCAHCDEPLPDDAVFCPECGSDAETGWSDDVDYQSVELPEPEHDEARREGSSMQSIALLIVIGIAFFIGAVLLLFLARSSPAIAALVGFVLAVEILFQVGILKRSFFRRR